MDHTLSVGFSDTNRALTTALLLALGSDQTERPAHAALHEYGEFFSGSPTECQAAQDFISVAITDLHEMIMGLPCTPHQKTGLMLMTGYGIFLQVLDTIQASKTPIERAAYLSELLKVMQYQSLVTTLKAAGENGTLDMTDEGVLASIRALGEQLYTNEIGNPQDALLHAVNVQQRRVRAAAAATPDADDQEVQVTSAEVIEFLKAANDDGIPASAALDHAQRKLDAMRRAIENPTVSAAPIPVDATNPFAVLASVTDQMNVAMPGAGYVAIEIPKGVEPGAYIKDFLAKKGIELPPEALEQIKRSLGDNQD